MKCCVTSLDDGPGRDATEETAGAAEELQVEALPCLSAKSTTEGQLDHDRRKTRLSIQMMVLM